MSEIRFAKKQYPKIDDDQLYDLICNLHYQIQHRQPGGPAWMNYGLMQWPQDLIAYQELLWRVKPELIIETGTAGGGCTLFFASILDLLKTHRNIKHYRIVTIDFAKTNPHPDLLSHPHIIYIQGDSESREVIEKVKSYWNQEKVTMVFLDSSHDEPHVSKEMEAYGPLVSVGSYMVVEDTWLGYTLVCENNPLMAVEKWIKEHDNWIIDRLPERWMITQHPCGWLKRVK